MSPPLPFDTLAGATAALRRGDVSSRSLTQSALDRIQAHEPACHAFNSVWAERAMHSAALADSGELEGPLAGVPIAIKDNLCTDFGTTTCSSRMLEGFRSPYSATVVRRLQEAGAVIVGKTNMDEFAMGSSTENSAFGPTRNPWDTTRVPGGSSGGSAAAVAAGFCCAAIGSDTGGSVRQPASLCGITGMKPTYGLVSRYGLVAYASSLDQIGPMAWTSEDAAILLSIIAGHDDKDSTSWREPVGDLVRDIGAPIKGLRLGVVREYESLPGLDPQVAQATAAAIEVYRSLGATVVPVSLPHTEYAIAAYYILATAEASGNLARYDGIHYGHRTKADVSDIVELYCRSREEALGAEVKRRIMLGTYALSAGYYDAFYLKAMKVRRLIRNDFDAAFKECDCIACPTSPVTAFRLGEKTQDPLQMYLCDVFTVPSNMAGIPGISIPCGLTRDAHPLPIGLQLLGPLFGDGRLLQVAHAYQQVTPWHTHRPSAF